MRTVTFFILVAETICLVSNDTDAQDNLGERTAIVQIRVRGGDVKSSVTEVSFPKGAKFDGPVVDLLKPFVKLRTLDLDSTDVTDSQLAGLDQLKELTDLNLAQSCITNAGLVHLSRIRSLTFLSLSGVQQIDDQGLPNLAKIVTLQRLILSGTNVTDNGLRDIGNLQNLQELGLMKTSIRGSGMKHLVGLKELMKLDLESAQIDDEGLSEIGKLSNLREIDLGQADITDVGLSKLFDLKKLHKVDLVGASNVSTAGVEELRKALPSWGQIIR